MKAVLEHDGEVFESQRVPYDSDATGNLCKLFCHFKSDKHCGKIKDICNAIDDMGPGKHYFRLYIQEKE